jgi:hypothetical protein
MMACWRKVAVIGTVCVALVSAATASDLKIGAYIGIPFGGEAPFYGFSAGIAENSRRLEDDVAPKRMEMDIRSAFDGDTVMSINEVPVARSIALGAADEPAAGQQVGYSDWQIIAAAAVSVGLIALIANADNVRVDLCSGKPCPPEEKPPVEPAPTPLQ